MPKRSGRKSAAQTPAPKAEQIKGSKKNPKGTAASEKAASKIKLSDETINVLKDKLDKFKEKYPSKKNVNLNDLKAVYRRGSGAYSSSHRPTISGGKPNSRAAWSYARVNKFLEKAAGKPVKKAYVQDDDLLENGGTVKGYIQENFPIISDEKLKRDDIIKIFKINKNVIISIVWGGRISKGGKSYMIYVPNRKGIMEYNISSNIIDGRTINSMIKKNELIEIDGERDKYTLNFSLFENVGETPRFADGGLIAPNGKPSNLTPEQYELVRTPEFKAWFGDWENDPENASKVVDENGEPLFLINSNNDESGLTFRENEVLYATTDEEWSDIYGIIKRKVVVNIQNPYTIEYAKNGDDFIRNENGEVIYDGEPTEKSEKGTPYSYRYIDDTIKNNLLDRGYDGIISKTESFTKIDGTVVPEQTSVVAFQKSKVKDNGESYASGGRVSNSRSSIPNVRGGWTKDKILRYLKQNPSDTTSTYTLVKYISEFDNWEQFKEHIYYHGTPNYIDKGLKPSIVFSERFAESQGGGGYGERYWGISLTKRKRTAESFSGMGRSVTIYPVILKKDAKVIHRTDLQDSSEIEDIIVELYENGIDAVWIGGGEEELVVVNPNSILLYKNGSEIFNVYGGFKSNNLTDEEIKHTYETANELWEKYKNEYATKTSKDERDVFIRTLPQIKFADGGLIAPNGKPSNLTPEQYKLVRTPEFKAWFGDWENDPENASKVVDENGEPKVMWHYAKRLQYEIDKFYAFNVDKQLGSHFGTIKQAQNLKYIPSGESELKNPEKDLTDFRYYQVFLNIKNPIRLKDVGIFGEEELLDAIDLIKPLKDYDWEYFNKYDRKLSRLNRIKDWLLRTLYIDGIVYLNRYETNAKTSLISSLDDVSDELFKNKIPDAEDSWIAFYPNQIKLADGTNTTFDANNPDIRFADGGEPKNSQMIQCVRCDWTWDTADSDPEDMYVCHKCGFDNTLFYEGGILKPTLSVQEMAEKHNVDIEVIIDELIKGAEHEMEHTDDIDVAIKIASHHVAEMPDYYEKLEQIEKMEDGGDVVEDNSEIIEPMEIEIRDYLMQQRAEAQDVLHCTDTRVFKAMICKTKIEIAEKRLSETQNPEEMNCWNECIHIWSDCMSDIVNNNIPVREYKDGGEPCGCGKMYEKGGLAYGNSHDKGGMPLVVKSTGQNIEIEGGEGVVNKRSMQMTKKVEFEGRKMTPCEVISKINQMGGGVKFKCEDVKEIIAEDGHF